MDVFAGLLYSYWGFVPDDAVLAMSVLAFIDVVKICFWLLVVDTRELY